MRAHFHRVLIIFATFFLSAGQGVAQKVTVTPLDHAIFQSLQESLNVDKPETLDGAMIRVGKALIGTPYKEKTLEVGEKEHLVVNLRGMDCTTYVENVLVLGRMLHKGEKGWNYYLEELQNVRYRNGKIKGYPSRLHYFTDWIRENERKGLVMDVTEAIGGVTLYKPINFMGTHRDLYPYLASKENFRQIRMLEAEVSAAPICVLPASEVTTAETKIQQGDIIALATDIKGLDVTHTGIAIRMGDGRIHLLHASTKGAVMISEQPISDYLKGIRNNIGIVVARPLPNF
ncbi:N-acetylmuramoyl-L-alanine amidase-like domain-containing protein [Robiginitalea sp. IMCC43444]|uniref:N-acetylmuramoyl-L-alanine amidase-like domain-containing protein n=1 Tax=Robiginitalea sp. IMCC43444 TaxID=3459121 RepID=UPI004041BDBD